MSGLCSALDCTCPTEMPWPVCPLLNLCAMELLADASAFFPYVVSVTLTTAQG